MASARRYNSSATFELATPFRTHKCDGPSQTVTATKEELLAYYSSMVQVRRMEIVADTLYKQRLIRGFCHLYDGQEAVAVGMNAALDPQDYLITAYRGHGWSLLRGDSLFGIFSELMGKRSGSARGKGGSMHMYWPGRNYFGGNGIVGAQVPLGAGLAFTSKYSKQNLVSVAIYGDGAANQGQIFEAANMAALWDLPVIFVCENNQYGMGTSIGRASASSDFYNRIDFIPGIAVDGMNVLASREAMRYAADWARSGKGPIALEMKTYRYHGHSMSDPGISYRTRDEVSEVRATRDCIAKVKSMILEHQWATEEELKAIDKQIRKEVDQAVKEAKEASELPPDELFTDIYVEGPPEFRRYPDILVGQ